MYFLTTFADYFFLNLWPLLLWAVAIGAASTWRHWKGGVLSCLLALVPVGAAVIYFGVSLASDESFLVAGVIPWSDAAMHFRQAAEMAVHGVTHVGMNGRFLYPAYFSSLLNFTQYNLLWAQVAGGFLFAGSLVLALRFTARLIGGTGAAVVALVCGLFFRERCAGLIMTENLGLLCGLLSLSAFLLAIERRSFPFLFSGIFILAFGLCARPGALFVLPLMVLFAGWFAWHEPLYKITQSWVRATAVASFAVLLILSAFGSNTLLSRTIYEGKVIANGNFAFTLYGMLTGGKWSDALSWSHYNAPLVMQESIKLIKEKPQLLVMGAARAYQAALYRRILFMFHNESRPATLLLIAAVVGLIALWRSQRLKPYALWLTLMAMGILLSIPFVPPWDAAERPFAATVPFQALLAGIGAAVVWRFFCSNQNNLSTERDAKPSEIIILFLMLVVVIFLSVPLPLFHKMNKQLNAQDSTEDLVILKRGSFVTITPTQYDAFIRHQQAFLEHYPAQKVLFEKLPHQVILGIDWKSKNLDHCVLLEGATKIVPFAGWLVDPQILNK